MTRLREGFATAFADLTLDPAVFAPDAFFDLNMPVWRFQLEGAAPFVDQLRAINEGPATVTIERTIPTASGFVTEQVETQAVDGHQVMARRLWLCEVRQGRIVEATGFCSGEWSEELRARHAAEAPLLR